VRGEAKLLQADITEGAVSELPDRPIIKDVCSVDIVAAIQEAVIKMDTH
jgi:hypothetical protein